MPAKLLGMGNPLLDISANVDKEFLNRYGLEENNAILAEEKHIPLYKDVCDHSPCHYIPGGATQNSIRFAQYHLKTPKSTCMIGCVGEDEYSKKMEEIAVGDGVDVHYMVDKETPTGTCAVLINGHHRSLVANLSAANNYKISHLEKDQNWKFVTDAEVYYISGFFLTVSPESMIKVGKHAAESNKIFCFNLSAPFLCQFFKDQMLSVIPYTDYIFGNETEIATFAEQNAFECDTKDLKSMAKKLQSFDKVNSKRARTVVITQGCDPTIVVKPDGSIVEFTVTALSADQIVDTNAAGDAFVGGFISQIVLGKSLEDAVHCGHWSSHKVIQVSGCELPKGESFSS